ncbi:MAG: NUDIX hydrolase [Hyphomicrobiaceae bacterium]
MQDNSSRHESDQDGPALVGLPRDRKKPRPDERTQERIEVELVAAVLAMLDEEPVVMLGTSAASDAASADAASVLQLPSCHFEPSRHETLDTAVRAGVLAGCSPDATHLEQLSAHCTERAGGQSGIGALSVGYLALVRADRVGHLPRSGWLKLYDVLPWEDWRQGRPTGLSEVIVPGLMRWLETSNAAADSGTGISLARVRIAFGLDESSWDDERVIERLEILEEAGLLAQVSQPALRPTHRRIIAAALGRLRSRIRHRPVVFELLPAQFTLFELQRAVEAILGPHLHKQNFRRLVEGMGLVEPTGDVRSHTGGRPARLFRFRPAVMLERASPGMRIRPGKAA